MRTRVAGFTLIELIIVIVIGSILTGLSLSMFQNVQARFAVRGAKQAYMAFHQGARSRAVEMGETVILVVYTAGDSALYISPSAGVTNVTRFDEQFAIDLTGPSYFLCMTPRGYADYDCGSYGAIGITATYPDTVRLGFELAGDTASVLILPMGQLVGD